jgi:hypothetical protein
MLPAISAMGLLGLKLQALVVAASAAGAGRSSRAPREDQLRADTGKSGAKSQS